MLKTDFIDLLLTLSTNTITLLLFKRVKRHKRIIACGYRRLQYANYAFSRLSEIIK